MSERATFREVIRPPLWLMAFIYFMFFSLVIAVWAALDNRSAAITAVISLVLGIVIYFKAGGEISFDGEVLRAGRAHIEKRFLGDVVILNQSDFIKARTREADPAAFLALIFWVSQGVKIEITDERDSTPYWLISTKRGEKLAKALKS
jgi:hypothetical protein